jgi:hypothetical protein
MNRVRATRNNPTGFCLVNNIIKEAESNSGNESAHSEHFHFAVVRDSSDVASGLLCLFVLSVMVLDLVRGRVLA